MKNQCLTLIIRACAGLVLLAATGCTGPQLGVARSHYYAGQYDQAIASISEMPENNADAVLILMERGMFKQAKKDYRGSLEDWQDAININKARDYYSLSHGAASLLVNDNTLIYQGKPFERVFLHTFSAKSYMALGLWQDAAVEGRNIIYRLEHREGFPDDAYSRYMAAFTLEMFGDQAGAAFQYKQAAALLPGLAVDAHSGRITAAGTNSPYARQAGISNATVSGNAEFELVCFIEFSRLPSQHDQWNATQSLPTAPYAEIYCGTQYLGRSYPLTSTAKLSQETAAKLAAMQLAKDVTRIAVKESVAYAVSKQDESLGELVRIILYALEAPDTRRWETLPKWLEVARVPCPADPSNCRIVVRDSYGRIISQLKPEIIAANNRVYVAFIRAL